MIDFACDVCGKRFSVPDSLSGKKATCKQCKSPMRIPQAKGEPDDDFGLDINTGPVPAIATPPVAASHATKFCFHCGSAIAALAEICPKCGVRQHDANSPGEPKSKVLAAVFAMFLGGLGMHKFYLGQPWLGLLYLLLCWTFIPAIVAFVEGVMFLVMKDAEFQRKYSQ